MNRFISKFVVGAAAAAMVLAAAGISAPAYAQDNSVLLWINGDKGYNGIAEIGKKFTKDTGVSFKVETPEDPPGRFQSTAPSGTPDIFCWAHDRLGEWKASGLVSEIKPSQKIVRAIERKGWDAFTIKGKVYGYPYAFEAIGLIYNKKLVSTPPKSFEDIAKLHDKVKGQGARAIMWAYDTPYFSFPLLAAKGGYSFARRSNGTYDTSKVGVNNPGAVKGLETIIEFIQKGIMPKGVDHSAMMAEMTKGKLATMITGPWAWKDLKENKIDFGVAKLPSLNGAPSKPFVGVQGCMINQHSRNKALATEFIESYLLTTEGLKRINDDKPLGVPAHKGFYKQLSRDPKIKATMDNVVLGVIMPNIPEMSRFWSAMQSALQNATSGRQKPKEALDNAAKRIKSN